jgi:hypothetical protein
VYNRWESVVDLIGFIKEIIGRGYLYIGVIMAIIHIIQYIDITLLLQLKYGYFSTELLHKGCS